MFLPTYALTSIPLYYTLPSHVYIICTGLEEFDFETKDINPLKP